MSDEREWLQAYAERFAGLTPADLDRLARDYAPGVRFVDPFNDVVGIDAVRAIFVEMFARVDAPRFEILETASLAGIGGYIRWRFHFRRAGVPDAFEGVSRIAFDAEGRVTEHLDFWDPTPVVYARIPLLGAALAWVRRRLSARPGTDR